MWKFFSVSFNWVMYVVAPVPPQSSVGHAPYCSVAHALVPPADGVAAQVDHWASVLSTAAPSAKVRGMPDSGFFLDMEQGPKYHSNMQNVCERSHRALRRPFFPSHPAAAVAARQVSGVLFGRAQRRVRGCAQGRCWRRVEVHLRAVEQRSHQDADVPDAEPVRCLADGQRDGRARPGHDAGRDAECLRQEPDRSRQVAAAVRALSLPPLPS